MFHNLRFASAIVSIFLVAALTATAIHALHVQGTVATPCDDELSSLQVAAYARSGRFESSAAVTANATFNLFLRPSTTTHYVLHLLGAIENHYHPFIVQVDPDHVLLSQVRSSPLLKPPVASADTPNRNTTVHFEPHSPTRYALKRRRKRWSLRNLWAYRLYAMMLAGAVFIIWFPKIIRDLPQDLREELLGEKEHDMGDPNALFKSLCGMEDKSNRDDNKSKTA